MRLTELNPNWCASAGRHGMGFTFLCPCCLEKGIHDRWTLYFANPLDGGPFMPIVGGHGSYRWKREGETFDTLTLTPSVNLHVAGSDDGEIPPEQHWHGFINNGVITTV